MNTWNRSGWTPVVVSVLAGLAALVTATAQAAPQALPGPALAPVAAPGALSAPAAAAATPTGLVMVDQAALRAAPRDAAPLLAPLWRGEALQIRATRGDWLQVWDADRERGGFVRAPQVMALPEGPAGVAALAAQLRLLRQQPGAESLGMGVAAALIERAEPAWLASAAGADTLETLVVLQERLALRVQNAGPGQQAAAAAHADVARRYGFALQPVARADGSVLLCPNDKPADLLLAHAQASAAQQALAALSRTRVDCLSSDLLPSQRTAVLEQHAQWLWRVDGRPLPTVTLNRLLLRRASVMARLAFARRAGDPAAAAAQARAAWAEVVAEALTDDDTPAVREAAVLLSPQRWLLQPRSSRRELGRFQLSLQPGGPGETCLVWSAPTGHAPGSRCSHGIVHLDSARLSPDGSTVVLSVQPLEAWTELWRLEASGTVAVLPPAAEAPGVGAVEWAGWTRGNDGVQVLVAREAEAGGRVLRRFEVYGGDWAAPVRWSGEWGTLGAFQRSADPAWRMASTLAR